MFSTITVGLGKVFKQYKARKVSGKKLPYTKSRPNYAKGQRQKVWEKYYDPKIGGVKDPTGKIIPGGKTAPPGSQWQMGHKPGFEYRYLHKLYLEGVISKETFIKEFRNPNHYRPELGATNAGHAFEAAPYFEQMFPFLKGLLF